MAEEACEHCMFPDLQDNTGKNNGFPFLDILGYLKNKLEKKCKNLTINNYG